ncbi:hypothetical protein C3L33_00492, partial [Rhododendron williamsianum]
MLTHQPITSHFSLSLSLKVPTSVLHAIFSPYLPCFRLCFSSIFSSTSRAVLTMAGVEAKIMQNPPPKKSPISPLAAQICLRLLGAAASLSAALVTITSKQTVILYGVQIDAQYTYSSAFTLKQAVTTLLMAACAAATAIGFVGKFGNSHVGWMAICNDFGRFCDRIIIAVTLSYLAFLVHLLLTVISANKSRGIHV